ncbi:MAG: hypothetical protein ACAI37_20350 [Chthoniobacter sp.]
MKSHHFTAACLQALQRLSIPVEQFGYEMGLTTLGLSELEKGRGLPREIYRPAFKFFLRTPETASVALDLGKACLLDSLEECALDEDSVHNVQRGLTSEAAVAHMFGQLPIAYLVAMSVIGTAAEKNPVVHNTMFCLAELCRAIAEDRNVPKGFFSQHWKPAPTQRVMLGGALGELAVKIHGVSPEE